MRLALYLIVAALVAIPVLQGGRNGKTSVAGGDVSKAKSPLLYWSSTLFGAGVAVAIAILDILKNG
jgi:hypothetical protein